MSGVLLVNGVLLAVGFCLLAPALRGLGPMAWVSWAGVALLAGAALVGLAVFLAAIVGATAGPWTFAVVAGSLALVGVASAVVVPRGWLAPPAPPVRPRSGPVEDAAATVAATAVFALALGLLVGGFRSSPWLDDAWGIWLPKGVALAHRGLDERLFVPGGTFVHFEVPDYPLWWSVLTGLELRIAGTVDVRAMNAQLAILVLAFLAAVARLLWGWVRPWVLWGSLLVVCASPAFLRHAQSGMADLPLGLFLSVALLSGVGWLVTGRGFYLCLVGAFGAAAAVIKSEGLPELLLLFLVLGLFFPTRRVRLWLVVAMAAAATVPWLAWRAAHDIGGRIPLGEGLDPSFLADRIDRLGPALEALVRHLLDPTDWLLVVPLAVALSFAGFLRERRAPWLVLPALLGVGAAFLAWSYWADRDEIGFLVATSAYRTIDPLVLTAAVATPLLAELVLTGPDRPSPPPSRETRSARTGR